MTEKLSDLLARRITKLRAEMDAWLTDLRTTTEMEEYHRNETILAELKHAREEVLRGGG